MTHKFIINKYGFYELANKPTKSELEEYYSKKYYQETISSSYAKNYSDDEIKYINNKLHQKTLNLNNTLMQKPGNFLDVGAGEGYALKYFADKGWSCTGLDYSLYAIEAHNPELKNCVISGDISNSINRLIKSKQKFKLIWLDNVLEHVLDPFQLLSDLFKIIDSNGVLVVEVPNDFSILQQQLLTNNNVSNEYWITSDHISYFNKAGLTSLSGHAGWKIGKFIANFPIDFDLFCSNTNYINNPDVGKNAHLKRLAIENLLHLISPEKTNVLYEALAELGLGRCITAYLTHK